MATIPDSSPNVHRTVPSRMYLTRSADLALKSIFIALGLAFFVSLGVYLRYSFHIYPTLGFNSDDAAALLFSNEVLQQHSLFPDWYNATGIALPFTSPELLLLPVLMIVSNHWMADFRVAVAVDQLLMCVLVWWVLGRVGLSRALRLFLLCFLFASVSSWMAEQTVMIAGKDWFYAQMLLLCFLVFRCIRDDAASGNLRGRMAWVFAVGTLLFIDRSNISQMLPPLFIALTALGIPRFEKRSLSPILVAGGALASAAVAGQLVFRFLLPHGVAYNPIAPTFVDLNTAGANFLLMVRGLMDLFGAVPVAGANVYSIASIWWVVKLALLIVVFLGPLWLLARWRSLNSDFLRLLVVVFAVSLALRVLVYVFTGISVGVTQTNRYFISDAFIGLTVMLLYFEQHWRPLPTRASAFCVAAVLVASSPLLIAKPASRSEHQQLVRFLEANHLAHGYATFWNAGVLTGLSGDRVQVRQIILGSGDIQPFRWLASSRWYDGDPNVHESFLLLKGAERAFNLEPLVPVLGKPTKVENFGDFRALVYPFDLALRLGWKYTMDEKLPPADRHVAMQRIGSPVWSGIDHRWTVTLRLTNLGALPIGSSGKWPVNLGVHLLSPAGKLLDNDYARVSLPMLANGQSDTLVFETPDSRADGNILEFDPVQENVAWFSQAGSPVLRVQIPEAPKKQTTH